MKLDTDNLKYGSESNVVYKIVTVALRHGLNENIEKEFRKYVDQCIEDYIEYRMWEVEMGEDL